MRHIASETFTDEYFGTLPMMLRVLWVGLIAAVADDQGRFIDNAALIRSIIFPYDEKISIKDIDAGLNALAKAKKIERYTHTGKRLIQIVNWWKYQKSTQWAAESLHPAPPKWTDRVRIHKPGLGNVPYILNWDYEGGFVQPTKVVDTNLSRRYTKTKTKTKIKTKTKTTPHTPLKGEGKEPGGGGDVSLSISEQRRMSTVSAILEAGGLRNPRRTRLAEMIATRKTVRDDMLAKYVIAALASAYTDKTAKNKIVCAAHRLENGEVADSFLNPDTWRDVPNEVLAAAGILKERKSQRMVYENGQLVAVPA